MLISVTIKDKGDILKPHQEHEMSQNCDTMHTLCAMHMCYAHIVYELANLKKINNQITLGEHTQR